MLVSLVACNAHNRSVTDALAGQLEGANALLEQAGLDAHVEPSALAPAALCMRCRCVAFAPAWFELLQRFRAHMMRTPGATPPAAGVHEEASEDGVLDEVLEHPAAMASHLLCHAPEGLFVPLAFDAPLFDGGAGGRVAGGWLGSSQGLLAELLELSAPLGVELRPLRGRGALRRGGGLDVSDGTVETINAIAAAAEGAQMRGLAERSELDADSDALVPGGAKELSGDSATKRRQESRPHTGGRLQNDKHKVEQSQTTKDMDGQAKSQLLAQTPFWRELIAWFALYEAARLSVAHGTAIAFTS